MTCCREGQVMLIYSLETRCVIRSDYSHGGDKPICQLTVTITEAKIISPALVPAASFRRPLQVFRD